MEEIDIVLCDDSIYKFPDTSYSVFEKYIPHDESNSDLAYENYLHDRCMRELTDFNAETINGITLVVKEDWRERVLKFKCVYDSDNDEDFNPKDYF